MKCNNILQSSLFGGVRGGFLFLLLSAFSLGMQGQERGALVLRSPQDYQVYAVSPNGEWACGVYVNLNNMYYGFRWNLLTGKTELLSGDDCMSEASSISNDGVVAGMYDNSEATDNGAPAYTAGYWKDGRWYHLPNIDDAPIHNNDQTGYANSIAIGGGYIGGAYNDKDSRLIPLIWKDGKIEHVFTPEDGCEGMIYTISADGQRAAGWSITPNSEKARVATLWEVGKGDTLIMDEKLSNAWCSARKFSPNGKYLLFWEGYYDTPADQITDPTAPNMALRALYNVETGEKTDMPTLTRDPFNFDVFDVTDSGTIVGYESPEATMVDQAIIFKDGQTHWLYDYLQERGVDLDADSTILRENGSTYFIRAVGISNDEKTFAVLYYDTEGALCTMVIKLDENLTSRPPVQVEANQLAGINAARLRWEAPLAGANGVTGYNIYRDGQKVNDTPVTGTAYIDASALKGNHSYHLTALYGDVESEASETVSLQIAEASVQAPRGLFARQVGYSGAWLQWDAPRSNLAVMNYYEENAEVTGFGGGSTSFEAAIRIPAEEVSYYAGYGLISVGFYPMTPQEGWKVNVYKTVADSLQLIHSQTVAQTLEYGKENVVALTGVEMPHDADLYVAIEVTVAKDHTGYNVLGEVNGDPIPGQTDLLRMTTEPEFYSLYEEGQKYGATQLTTWAISVNLASPGTKVADVDLIDYYSIYDDAEEIGVAAGRLFLLETLPEGEHLLGVKAIYKDGRSSDIVTCPLTIAPDEGVYKAVTNTRVTNKSACSVDFAWDVPMDDDETFLTHSTDALQGGVLGAEENNYNYMVAAIYSPTMTRGYDGYRVKAFKFYPLSEAEFTFVLEEDGKTVCEAWPEVYTPGLWNTVELSKEVTIKAGCTYRLLLDCYDVAPGTAPLGLDARMPFVEAGDLYSQNEGATYTSVSQASAFGNWMMGLVLVNPDAKPLPVDGYSVRIDNKTVTDALLTEPAFSYDFPEGDATHRVNVDVQYTAERVVKGGAVFFQVGPNSIGDNRVALLRVEQGDCYLRVTGDGISEVNLVNISGQTILRAAGSELNIGSLSAGTYVLRIHSSRGVESRKVCIVR